MSHNIVYLHMLFYRHFLNVSAFYSSHIIFLYLLSYYICCVIASVPEGATSTYVISPTGINEVFLILFLKFYTSL